MTWLIIGVVLLVAFGPVMWLLPSKRDRRLAALRERARREGLIVELRRLPKLDPTPEERVSAGGKVRDPVVECMAYSLTLPRRLRMLEGWRILRHAGAVDDKVPRAGWVVDPGMFAARPHVARVAQWLEPLLGELPDDVIGVELTAGSAGVYWLEKGASSEATVGRLAELLRQFGDDMVALERQMQEELEGDDS